MYFIYFARMLLLLLLVLGIVMIFKIYKFISLDKRISRYSLNDDTTDLSILDKFFVYYTSFGKKFYKSNFLKKKSSHYNKYLFITDEKNPCIFILNKLIIGILFTLLIITSYAIQGKAISFISIIIIFIIGYYFYDIYLYYQEKRYKRQIKSELLKAVIIMNNAFKAGKSTLQATKIASDELPTPISYEFMKIYHDMSYGLSVDVAFERFSKRVNLTEAKYISSSLIILNKTGGNIVNVFSSMEKTLFDKMKLESDLKNSTAASNLVVKVLMLIPIIFVLIIYMMNPNYFDPLISSSLGYFILVIILLMFIIFIYLLNKIMKVKV